MKLSSFVGLGWIRGMELVWIKDGLTSWSNGYEGKDEKKSLISFRFMFVIFEWLVIVTAIATASVSVREEGNQITLTFCLF